MKRFEDVKNQLEANDFELLAEIGWNYLQSKKEGDSE